MHPAAAEKARDIRRPVPRNGRRGRIPLPARRLCCTRVRGRQGRAGIVTPRPIPRLRPPTWTYRQSCAESADHFSSPLVPAQGKRIAATIRVAHETEYLTGMPLASLGNSSSLSSASSSSGCCEKRLEDALFIPCSSGIDFCGRKTLEWLT